MPDNVPKNFLVFFHCNIMLSTFRVNIFLIYSEVYINSILPTLSEEYENKIVIKFIKVKDFLNLRNYKVPVPSF